MTRKDIINKNKIFYNSIIWINYEKYKKDCRNKLRIIWSCDKQFPIVSEKFSNSGLPNSCLDVHKHRLFTYRIIPKCYYKKTKYRLVAWKLTVRFYNKDLEYYEKTKRNSNMVSI